MIDQSKSQEQSEQELASVIYNQAFQILQEKGKRFSRPDGTSLSAKSFFCDEKDARGSSDIDISMDALATEGSITIVSVRQYPNNNSLIRELKLGRNGIESLTVRDKVPHDRHNVFHTLYSTGRFDRSWISLEAVFGWLSEAKVNLDAGIIESPCDDFPRRIGRSPRLVENRLSSGPKKSGILRK